MGGRRVFDPHSEKLFTIFILYIKDIDLDTDGVQNNSIRTCQIFPKNSKWRCRLKLNGNLNAYMIRIQVNPDPHLFPFGYTMFGFVTEPV